MKNNKMPAVCADCEWQFDQHVPPDTWRQFCGVGNRKRPKYCPFIKGAPERDPDEGRDEQGGLL